MEQSTIDIVLEMEDVYVCSSGRTELHNSLAITFNVKHDPSP